MTPTPVADDAGPWAVVLAAGLSRRMGQTKALLAFGRETFLSQVVSVCRATPLKTVVVYRAGHRAIENELDRIEGRDPFLTRAPNPMERAEMVDSFRCGLSAIDAAHGPAAGAMVWPVDVPAVNLRTVQLLVRTASDNPGHVVRPVFRGRTGHPVWLPPSVLNVLRNAPDPPGLTEGLRSAIHFAGPPTLGVDVDDEGVLLNINAPKDLARLTAATAPGTAKSSGLRSSDDPCVP